ncbi:MAG: helix-turn-helix domain-containing protein [Bacillota bacterium]
MGVVGTTEAARRLGLTNQRITAMIRAGQVAAQKIGRTWVVDEAEIERLRHQERKPGRPRKRE